MSSAPQVCARCAALGKACCVSAEGVAGPPVTPGDIARIEAASGRRARDFTVSREVDAIEQQAWEEEDPAARGLVREGRVLSLARDGDACVFLGRAGCTLGESRPLLCRRFPFVRRAGRLEVKPGGDCLAVSESAGLPSLLVALNTSRRELRSIDAQLALELRGGD